MNEPTPSKLWKEAIKRPIQIGENLNENAFLLFHALCYLQPRQLAALLVSRVRRVTEQPGRLFQPLVQNES